MLMSWWLFKQRVKRFRNKHIRPCFIALTLERTPAVDSLVRLLHLEIPIRWVTILLFSRGAIIGQQAFHSRWYRKRYSSILTWTCPRLFHAAKGEQEQRDPSPYFSTVWYGRKYADSLRPGQSPLVHFLLQGHELGFETHPFFMPCTAEPKPRVTGKLLKLLTHRPTPLWGVTTPDWILQRRDFQGEGQTLWDALGSFRIAEFPPLPVRPDDWCERAGRPVKRAPRSPSEVLTPPAMSINDGGTAPPRLCKTGRAPYVAEPGPVYAIGGTTLFLANDGSQCFDNLVAAQKRKGAFLLSSVFPYGDNRASISVRTRKQGIPRAILMTHDIRSNYYHWMVENLPRLLQIVDDPRYDDYPILLDDSMHRNMLRSVELLAPGRTLLRVGKSHAVRVEDAVYPSCVNISFEPRQGSPKNSDFQTDVAAMARLAARLSSSIGIGEEPLPSRLYVTRKGYQRNLTNAKQVEEYVLSRGFTLVDPGDLDLDSQVRLFRNADVIIVPSGSAATNFMFAKRGAALCTLHPAMTQRCICIWQTLAHVSGAAYTCIFGDPPLTGSPDDGASYFHRPFSIRIELLRRFLDAVDASGPVAGA